MRKRILLVEDEPALSMSLVDRLAHEGYAVDAVADGESGLDRAMREPFDLLLLDVMLPKRSGLDVLRELRQAGIATPVLMLTARGQLLDKVLGLKLGADDYLVKPFEFEELLARIEARLRRIEPEVGPLPQSYQFGDVRVDFLRTEAFREGQPVDLSAMELQLLRYLIARRGLTLSREDLLRSVWRYDNPPSTRTVDVHVASLRRKLEKDARRPEYILTIHRMGYKFVG